VIGETVNLASRLEGLCKDFKVSIVLSPSTEALVRGEFETRPLGDAKVRSFEEKIQLYTVLESNKFSTSGCRPLRDASPTSAAPVTSLVGAQEFLEVGIAEVRWRP
jgi:hypothetical protein